MSKWMSNLRHHLSHRPVTVLHGNVRDVYVEEGGRVFHNLTRLLKTVAQEVLPTLREFVSYDIVAGERRDEEIQQAGHQPADGLPAAGDQDAFAATAPDESTAGTDATPVRIMATWNQNLRSEVGRFYVFQYLDKFVAYKKAYTEQEQQLLLSLEKVIENITVGNRLVLVALRDSMVPVELYTDSPKTGLFQIPRPSQRERTRYLQQHISARDVKRGTLKQLADLTDGLFLRELDPLADELAGLKNPEDSRELGRLVNKYRVGEQEDYWGQLSIEQLRKAYDFFVEEEGVKGQDEAIGRVIDTLCLARAGLSGVSSGTAAKPRGALFFAGPTGVGKTFVAKKLAKFLFTTEEAFLRFDMSEFKEEHTVSKMIGSPPGYVGFEEGGMLTNGVREKPFCVVLFDEIEKAHPKILDIFLQILDDGRLTDSRGQTVYFTETILVFTSNIGTRSADSHGVPVEEARNLQALMQATELDAAEQHSRIERHFTEAVQRFFAEELSRPELLNRIGNQIIPFHPIDSEATQLAIVTSHLARIEQEIKDRYRKRGYQVHFHDSVSSWLVDSHGSRIAQFGGRGITNLVEGAILTPLAMKLLHAEHHVQQGIRFECSYAHDQGRLRISTGNGQP